ncbi:MAG TPA: hypothetical protein VFC32_03415, partial [Pseudolabrys sp.]|nr:hypothetical protein [Pseudolabrys sp.]
MIVSDPMICNPSDCARLAISAADRFPNCKINWLLTKRVSPIGGMKLRVSPFGPGTDRPGNGGGMKLGLPGVAFAYEPA